MTDEEAPEGEPRPRRQSDNWHAYGVVKATDKSALFHADPTNIFRIFPGDGTIHHLGLPTMGCDGLLMMQPRLNAMVHATGVGLDPMSREAKLRGKDA